MPRALLGNTDALEPLQQRWLAELRRMTFLKRLAELHGPEDPAAADLLVRRARHEADYLADGARQAKANDEVAVLDRFLRSYWQSWDWLGQTRASGLANELFELAKPNDPDSRGAQDFGAQKRAIRGARDALQRVGQHGSPAARGAAGLVLAQSASQYRSARERIVGDVIAVLPGCAPRLQQQLTWAVARLTGRQFGTATGRSFPDEISRDDVIAMLQWARSTGPGDPGPLAAGPEAYAPAAPLVRRVVPPIRQLERDLLAELVGDWAPATAALDEWLAAGIGCTPALRARLDPGQRSPSYPALAAALVIVADSNEQAARRELRLWRQAQDQPVWVRALAYTVLGALDARTGRWESGWPAGLVLPAEQLERGQPGWEYFGYVLAAGGQPMLERLQSHAPAPLSADVRARLTKAAERAARRRAMNGRR